MPPASASSGRPQKAKKSRRAHLAVRQPDGGARQLRARSARPRRERHGHAFSRCLRPSLAEREARGEATSAVR